MDRSREWGQHRAQLRGAVLGLAIGGTDAAETTAQFIRQQQASWRALAQELDLRPE